MKMDKFSTKCNPLNFLTDCVVGIPIQRLRNLVSQSVSDSNFDSCDTITLTNHEITE